MSNFYRYHTDDTFDTFHRVDEVMGGAVKTECGITFVSSLDGIPPTTSEDLPETPPEPARCGRCGRCGGWEATDE